MGMACLFSVDVFKSIITDSNDTSRMSLTMIKSNKRKILFRKMINDFVYLLFIERASCAMHAYVFDFYLSVRYLHLMNK